MSADFVIFDEQTISDKATFSSPHAYSTGFQYVIVNGELVLKEGKHLGVRSGHVLMGPGL
jgi:N-acyl-D-amino-acid deacylase